MADISMQTSGSVPFGIHLDSPSEDEVLQCMQRSCPKVMVTYESSIPELFWHLLQVAGAVHDGIRYKIPR